MTINSKGSVTQSAHSVNKGDYEHNNITHFVQGIVLNVYKSNDKLNKSSSFMSSKRGSRAEAKVLVMNDGTDSPWVLPNVVIIPPGPSGIDDYSEALPRPCSFMIDGSRFDSGFQSIDMEKVDGDYCLVGFIGGKITQPFMMSWFPHPSNYTDPATSHDDSVLEQGRRFFMRYRGAKLTITNEGSLFIDTNQSNHDIISSKELNEDGGQKRQATDEGGDIQLDVKKERKFEINFNNSIDLPDSEPSLRQKNPPDPNQATREDTATRITLNQQTIELIAGEVARILAKSGNVEILADGTINLGEADLSANKGVVQGEATDFTTGLSQFLLGNTSNKVRSVK